MEELFSGAEVFIALLSLNGDKGLGWMEVFISLAFWHFSWDFVKNEVVSFFREFYDKGDLRRVLMLLFWC